MKYLAVVPLILVLIGCGVKKPIQGRADPHPSGQISFSSPHLRDQTAVGTPIATRGEVGNILYITIPIRSTVNEQLYVDYRVTFFDSNGQELSTSAWFTRTLTPNVPDSITVRSMSGRAADFHVSFRPAK